MSQSLHSITASPVPFILTTDSHQGQLTFQGAGVQEARKLYLSAAESSDEPLDRLQHGTFEIETPSHSGRQT